MPFRFWNALSTDLNGIVKDIEREWIQLLDDTTKKERDYQLFLDRNAGFFGSTACSFSWSALNLVLEQILIWISFAVLIGEVRALRMSLSR
jgi:hypothetical protein